MSNVPRILVVESRLKWQRIICDILSREGHEPYPAYNIREVSQALQTQPFEMAVVNPVGETAKQYMAMLAEIKQKTPDIKFIITSKLLPKPFTTKIIQLYPATAVLYEWDKNRFISVLKSFVGEGPNTDDTRLRNILERSKYGTRPLKPPSLEKGIGRPKILCVETHQQWRQILIEVFNTGKMFWRLADNTEEALRILEDDTFHLIIIDFDSANIGEDGQMRPTQDLLDYLVEFRPKTKILVLSDQTSPEQVAHLFNHYPIVGLMEKRNFDPDVITQVVSEATKTPHLKIQTLGPFKIWRNGILIGRWQNSKTETIIKLLLTRQIEGGQIVPAEEILVLLGYDVDGGDYKRLLPFINEARLTLEPNINPKYSNFILRGASGYYFDVSSNVEWDLFEFRELNKHGKYLIDNHQWDEALETFEKAWTLYQEDYLFEDGQQVGWALGLRRQLSKEYSGTLANLADVYTAHERYDDGIKVCREALVNDPVVESVYRRLMRFYYWKGDKEQALKTYRHCQKLLEELFGECANITTRQLYQSILDDEEVINILL